MMVNYSFFPPAQLDRPQTIDSHSPLCSSPAKRPRICLLCRAQGFLVGCCVCFSGREPSKAMTYFIFDDFPSICVNSHEVTTLPHTFLPGRVVSPTSLPPFMPTIGWCCVSLTGGSHLSPSPHRSHYFFFGRSIWPPKRYENIIPTRSDPASPLLQSTL
jgi:hypothetical protein